MEPTIPTGSLLVIETQPTTAATIPIYRKGDIITFDLSDGELNTHRVVSVEKNQNAVFYTTKGDANEVEDGDYVHQKAVVGKRLFHISGVGYFVNFLKTPIGIALFVILPIILLLVLQFIRFFSKAAPPQSPTPEPPVT